MSQMSRAENYIVCGRVGTSDVVPGSVREDCFACLHPVIVYPNSQKLLNTRRDLKLKIVCSSCYMSAPDKDHIKTLHETNAPRELVSSIRNLRR